MDGWIGVPQLVLIPANEYTQHTDWVVSGAPGLANGRAEVSPSCEALRLGS